MVALHTATILAYRSRTGKRRVHFIRTLILPGSTTMQANRIYKATCQRARVPWQAAPAWPRRAAVATGPAPIGPHDPPRSHVLQTHVFRRCGPMPMISDAAPGPRVGHGHEGQWQADVTCALARAAG